MPILPRSKFMPGRGPQFMNDREMRQMGMFEELQQLLSRRMALLRERNQLAELSERQQFERAQEEKQIAEFALREGKISLWLEYKDQQAQARRLQEIQAFQTRYTRSQLSERLKHAY